MSANAFLKVSEQVNCLLKVAQRSRRKREEGVEGADKGGEGGRGGVVVTATATATKSECPVDCGLCSGNS